MMPPSGEPTALANELLANLLKADCQRPIPLAEVSARALAAALADDADTVEAWTMFARSKGYLEY